MKHPLDELIEAGAPSLPAGYFYTFDIQESGNLNGFLWSPSGKQVGQRHIWVAVLFKQDEQIRTWDVQDLVRLAKNLYEDRFPVETTKEKFASNIVQFLGNKFYV